MFPTFTHKPKCELKKYVCAVCRYVYNEVKGCPESNVAAGTHWHDLPWDWECPHCESGKESFNPISV